MPLIGRVLGQSDFLNSNQFEKAWEKRYSTTGKVLYNKLVYNELKLLYDHIAQLPLEVTHAQILSQTTDVGKHYDLKHNDDGTTYIDDYPNINDQLEPAGYKILLNNFDKESFYVAEGFGKKNNYIKLPKDTNTFVINEKTYPHGATMLDTPKYVVSIFGLINKEKHTKLIDTSLLKYPEYSIIFE